MTDLETRLRQIDPAGPPLGFDPDDVATKAAKRQRARRGVMATTAVTLAVAAGAVYIFGSVGPRSIPPAETAGPPSSRPPVDLTGAMARNRKHLEEVLAGTRDLRVGAFEQPYGDEALISTTVTSKDANGKPAAFTLMIVGPNPSKMAVVPLEYICGVTGQRVVGPDGMPLRCEKLPQPDGSTLVLQESGTATGDSSAHVTDVVLNGRMYRPDGTTLSVHDLREEVPVLTEPLITRLLTDPAFTLR